MLMLQLLAIFLKLRSQYFHIYEILPRSIPDQCVSRGNCRSGSTCLLTRSPLRVTISETHSICVHGFERLWKKSIKGKECRANKVLLKALFICLFSPLVDHSNGSFNLKALSGGSGYKFGVLAKIVNYMKTRHQRGDTHPLTLEEILDETQHLDIGLKQKQWLMSEALVNNPKIEVIDGKYAFKPKYNLKDKKALLRLLDKHDQRGLGGILLEDIEEGLPNAQKAIKALGDQIIFVNRPDKKKILFYNDKSCQFTVDEEFQKLWRSIPVDSMDEEKIEEYLKRQGISSMQEAGPKKIAPIQRRKKPASQKKRRFKTHNDHLAGVLKDYSDVVPGKQ
uniref:Ral transcription factor IIE subunit 2 n=1 Tax=Dromaius novaehollandiae TaxID=8790 RepID=A0A8C4K3E6_DRONO